MSDLNLRKTILEELEFQPDVDAAHIGVSVENGVVTLCGHVKNYSQKISTERAIKAIKGARAVAEEIQVRLYKGAGTADDTIANRALNISPGVPMRRKATSRSSCRMDGLPSKAT